MVNGSGPNPVNHSVWDRLKSFPSQLVGWFYGKFVTVSTKIKHVLSGGGSVPSADQPVSTSIGERAVSTTSNTNAQELTSLVTSSASNVMTPAVGGASHAESSNHLTLEQAVANEPQPKLTKGELLNICKDDFQIVEDDVQKFVSAFAKETNDSIKAYSARMYRICTLNGKQGFNDAEFLRLANELKAKETVSHLRKLAPSEKIKLLTDLNVAKWTTDKKCLKPIQFCQSRLKAVVPEYRGFVDRICASCQPNSAEPASKGDVDTVIKMVEQLDQFVSTFENGQIRDQIAQNGSLESKVSEIREKLKDLTQLVTASKKSYKV